MENKIRKKSINTVIYLLLAAMLVCVLFVSIYTVASKRPGVQTDDVTSAPDTTTAKASVTTDASVSTDAAVTDDSADIDVDVDADDEPVDAVVEDTLPTAETGDEELPVTVDVRYFVSPIAGMTSKDFEIDIPVYSLTMNDYRAHTGVDIAASLGSEVVAASSGIVCRVWSDPMMGQSVTIDHGDEIYTTYMNLSPEIAEGITVGAKVTMGQTIGSVGDTSLTEIAEEPHLHFEIKVNGQYADPLDYIAVSEIPENSFYEDMAS